MAGSGIGEAVAGSTNGAGGTPSAGSAGTPQDPGGGASDGSSGASAASAGRASDGNAGAAGRADVASSVSFSASRVTVTGVRGTSTPIASGEIRLHNAGATAVEITGITIGGADASSFTFRQLPAFPSELAAFDDLVLSVELTTTGSSLPKAPANKDLGCVLLTASVTASLASGNTAANLYGLLLTQPNYEPTLGQILTTQGYALDVGMAQNDWNPNQSMNAANLPGIEPDTDEVAASRFVKADSGDVELRVVARFSPVGALPYGWYAAPLASGCPIGCSTVGTMAMISDAQTSDKARMVDPPLATGSVTTFDPGDAPFGLWVYSDQKTQQFGEGGTKTNGDWDYSDDALNAPASVHRFKSYPLKEISHSYLVAVEEAGNGDYQDYVFLLSNVTALP